MDSVLLHDSPAYVDYVHKNVYHVQKFDLVLHHADGSEYDGSGCFPCFPWCRKPVYKPGEHITGHILIRPMRKITIIGVKILFEGIYRTDWKDQEQGIRWIGVRSFFQDCVNLIQNRVIELDCKWYKFDFEYVLPRNLISSSKESECKIAYQASGLVIQPYGNTQIQTFNTPFIVDGPLDISWFPSHLQQPLSKCVVKHFDPNCTTEENGQVLARSNNQILNENQCFDNGSHINESVTPQANPCSDVSLNTYNLRCPLEHYVVSTLWLSNQLLVLADQIQIELNIDNVTSEAIQARLALIQTVKLKANYAVMANSREFILPLETYVQKTNHCQIAEIWCGTLKPNGNESVSLTFKVPSDAIPSLLSVRLPSSCQSHITELFSIPAATEALVLRSYTVELELIPTNDKSTSCTAIAVEVHIAKANGQQLPITNQQQISRNDSEHVRDTEMTERSDSGAAKLSCDTTVETALDNFCSADDVIDVQPRPHSWCSPPTDSEGPPAYEEEATIRDKQTVQICDGLSSL